MGKGQTAVGNKFGKHREAEPPMPKALTMFEVVQ